MHTGRVISETVAELHGEGLPPQHSQAQQIGQIQHIRLRTTSTNPPRIHLLLHEQQTPTHSLQQRRPHQQSLPQGRHAPPRTVIIHVLL